MSYTIEGSHAVNTAGYVATQEQLAERIGSEYMDGAERDRVLVFENPGNQYALVIEGDLTEILDLLHQATAAVVREIEGG